MTAALFPILALLAATPVLEPDAVAPIPGSPGAAQITSGPEPDEVAGAPPAASGAAEGRLGEAQLVPGLEPGSPAAEGTAAWEAGRSAEAAALLARATEPEAALVRAMALLELDRHPEALRALEGLEAHLPDLADRIHLLRGEALSGAGRRREALAELGAVPPASLFAPQARLEQARVASTLGDRGAALDALSALLEAPSPSDPLRPDPAATALLLAGRLEAGGPRPDLAAARRHLLSCWVAHPLAPEAAECLQALRNMSIPFGVAPGPEEVLERAEALLEANRNGAAVALLEPLAAAVRGAAEDAPLACRIRSALGRAERRERNYPRAIALLRPVVEGCKDPQVRVRSLYVLAGATAIAGDHAEAVALYRQLERDFPDHPYADDALLYAAQLLERDGRPGEAREALSGLVERHPDGDQLGEARFLLAWIDRQAGDLDAAEEQLLSIERDALGGDPYEYARAAYWRGRILFGRGGADRDAAREAWTALAARYPTDYYGLLARARLAEAGSPLPSPRPALAAAPASYDPGPLRGDRHLLAALSLLRLGLLREAVEELQAIPVARPRPGEPLDPVLLVADLLYRAGDHRGAHQLLRTRARDAFRRAPDNENLRAWLIAYPPAYREEVQRSARSAGIPADLVQGLLREESALDPRVVSPAGAVGLAQLMLPTAQQVAVRLRLARPTRADLMQPPLNIRLGAQYLAELVRRYDGEVSLALAAYNAGAAAVGRWQEAFPGLSLDEFVEQIPVEETRGYVKRVLRSYAAYATLYGDGDGPAPSEIFRTARR
ncbi:MAG TPA: transglycosylase SLT domain-containing protein [Anaeromyxobacter sp.]|nr:transglycosylase SLT domain-containing protein [Anaeromyxobacter sp.]